LFEVQLKFNNASIILLIIFTLDLYTLIVHIGKETKTYFSLFIMAYHCILSVQTVYKYTNYELKYNICEQTSRFIFYS